MTITERIIKEVKAEVAKEVKAEVAAVLALENDLRSQALKKEPSRCCLCDDSIDGFGNNPSPLADSSLLCCDTCNTIKVFPARVKL
jgi:hypothetical protein